MWKTLIEVEMVFEREDGRLVTVRRKIEDPSIYRRAICRLMTKLGDILSAGRRKSWPGDQIWSKHIWGLYFYLKLKDIILFGRVFKAETRWHTGEVFQI